MAIMRNYSEIMTSERDSSTLRSHESWEIGAKLLRETEKHKLSELIAASGIGIGIRIPRIPYIYGCVIESLVQRARGL